MPKSLGADTGIRLAQPLSEAEQSAFLDESARAGGVDARPAPTLDEARVQAVDGCAIWPRSTCTVLVWPLWEFN